MQYRELGRTGWQVSAISFGAGRLAVRGDLLTTTSRSPRSIGPSIWVSISSIRRMCMAMAEASD